MHTLSYDNTPIATYCIKIICYNYNGIVYDINFTIVESPLPSIIGLIDTSAEGLITMLCIIDTIPLISKPPAKNYTRMFPVTLQISLDKEVWPLIHANKCIHVNFHDDVSIELHRMSKGIITSVNKLNA